MRAQSLIPAFLAMTSAVACSKVSGGSGNADAGSDASPRASSSPGTPGSVAVATVVLRHPVGITAVTGFEEVIPGGKPLPALYSDTYATATDNQTTFQLTLGQKRPAGVEKVCEFTVDGIPPGPKATQTFIVTVEIDETKNLRVKTRIQSSGAVREFGPFPIE